MSINPYRAPIGKTAAQPRKRKRGWRGEALWAVSGAGLWVLAHAYSSSLWYLGEWWIERGVEPSGDMRTFTMRLSIPAIALAWLGALLVALALASLAARVLRYVHARRGRLASACVVLLAAAGTGIGTLLDLAVDYDFSGAPGRIAASLGMIGGFLLGVWLVLRRPRARRAKTAKKRPGMPDLAAAGADRV